MLQRIFSKIHYNRQPKGGISIEQYWALAGRCDGFLLKAVLRTGCICPFETKPRTAAILETYTEYEDERIKKMAADALKVLQENAATTPREVIELRKEVTEMKKAQDKMRTQWKELQEQPGAQGKKEEEDD